MQYLRARKRLVVSVGILGALGLTASSFGVAGAQTPVEKKTLANVTAGGGGAGAPSIECAWALPDMVQPNTGTNGAPITGEMNYGTITSPSANFLDDDDDARTPSGAPLCTTNEGVENRPTQATQLTAGPIHIDVTPNLDDKVGSAQHLRWIELWSAIDGAGEQNPNAIVNWQVYHPDGSFKVQVEGTNYTPDDTALQCAGPAGMFNSATDSGQIEKTAVTNAATPLVHDTLTDWCLNGEKDLYYGAFGLSKHQPYGDYKVVANVINGANIATLTYWIHVRDVVGFAQDFTDVDFQGITGGAPKNINGNTIWDSPAAPVTPLSANRPSVQSTGNKAITVEMAYQNMCLQLPTPIPTPDCGPAKEILIYNGKLGSAINTVEARVVNNPPSPGSASPATGAYMNFVSPVTTNSGSERFRTLCPNDVFKIDFSLHAPASLTPGNYAGKVFLKVIAFGGTTTANGATVTPGAPALPPVPCPTDQGHVYYPFTGPSSINQYLGVDSVTVETAYNNITPKTTGYQA